MSHTDHLKRHDFVLLFDVKDGNPNGDPDADNYPRTDRETGEGIVTDVAIKRKVRDYVHRYHEQPIFIQNQTYLNQLIQQAFQEIGIEAPEITLTDPVLIEWFGEHTGEAFEFIEPTLTYTGADQGQSNIRKALVDLLDEIGGVDKALRTKILGLAKPLADKGKGKTITDEQRLEARRKLAQRYFDIRMFGAVLQTGLNAGQVRGPLQLTFARSLDRVAIQDHTTTRQARTTAARQETGGTEMGRKPVVNYGLYRAHGFYNPTFGEDTGVTDNDLPLFWEALTNLFDLERSASRGEMAVRGLHVFTHTNKRGDAPAHQLFDLITVKKDKDVQFPRQFSHYAVTVNDTNLPSGVSLISLVG